MKRLLSFLYKNHMKTIAVTIEVEVYEREIFHKHKKRLALQAQALVAEQAQP